MFLSEDEGVITTIRRSCNVFLRPELSQTLGFVYFFLFPCRYHYSVGCYILVRTNHEIVFFFRMDVNGDSKNIQVHFGVQTVSWILGSGGKGRFLPFDVLQPADMGAVRMVGVKMLRCVSSKPQTAELRRKEAPPDSSLMPLLRSAIVHTKFARNCHTS